MSDKTIIVITNTDSLLGYALAYRFLDKRKDKTEFRLLCRNQDLLKDLQNVKNGEIVEIKDYGDEKEMNGKLKSATHVLYIPGNSDHALYESKVLFKCAKHNKVNQVAMFSFVGVQKESSSPLDIYWQIEQEISISFNEGEYFIVQSSFWHQMFYYFGPMIEDENRITLILNEDTKWGTIDLLDLVNAVFNIFKNRRICKSLYQFTASSHMTTKKMVECAAHNLDTDIKYEKVDHDYLRDYLSSIHHDNRFRRRPRGSFTFPLAGFLNKQVIETMLAYLELINENKIHESQDLETELGKKTMTIQDFFRKHKDQFQRLK